MYKMMVKDGLPGAVLLEINEFSAAVIIRISLNAIRIHESTEGQGILLDIGTNDCGLVLRVLTLFKFLK